jgi:uracil-DNA glycosylase
MHFDDPRAEIDSLMAWWRDAGVDIAIDEAPHNWLASTHPKPPVTPSEVTIAAEARREVAVLPHFASVAALRDWVATDVGLLGDYPTARRVPAAVGRSDIVLVVDQPGRDDLAAGYLLAGDVGEQLDRMLKAIDLGRGDVTIIAMAPARIAADLDDAARALLTPLLVQHIALLAPKKLWLMGNSASRAILGMDVPAAQGRLHCVNHGGTTMDTIATVHPSLLLRQPRLKLRVWEDMQRLFGDKNA